MCLRFRLPAAEIGRYIFAGRGGKALPRVVAADSAVGIPMLKSILLATAATLALTGGATASRPMSIAGATAQHVVHAPPPGTVTLYDQNIGDSEYGFYAQTLSSYPQYNEYLADDFTIPAGHSWKVKEVDVTGYYVVESGPASSVNILFWSDKPGLPDRKGGPVVACNGLTPVKGLDTGSFGIKLPKACKASLAAGANDTTYWLTVQANMAGKLTSGYWAWVANAGVAGNQAASWYYGGGYTLADPRCLKTFKTIQDCNGVRFQPDLAFALYGVDSGG
jgi:hypothetical protein